MTPESTVKTKIRKFLRDKGWHRRAIASNEYTRAGLPDTYAIKNGIVLFIECKSSTGKMSTGQIKEMFDIKEHGGHYITAYGIQCIIDYCTKNNIDL